MNRNVLIFQFFKELEISVDTCAHIFSQPYMFGGVTPSSVNHVKLQYISMVVQMCLADYMYTSATNTSSMCACKCLHFLNKSKFVNKRDFLVFLVRRNPLYICTRTSTQSTCKVSTAKTFLVYEVGASFSVVIQTYTDVPFWTAVTAKTKVLSCSRIANLVYELGITAT